MEDLILKIVGAALISALCCFGVMKCHEREDLPFWVAASVVIVFLIAVALSVVGSVVLIWI